MAFTREHFSDITQQEARLERALAVFSSADQERVGAALAFARAAHQGQQRKWQAIPYVIHPIRVAVSLLEEFATRNPDVIIAALLHDVIEDCDVTPAAVAQHFGRAARRLVETLTWEPGRAVKWEQAERQVHAPRTVRVIRTADIIDNCRDLAVSCSADRVAALRLVYGYAHWGMRIAERVNAGAVRLLRDALRDVHGSCFAVALKSPLPPNKGKAIVIKMQNAKCRMQNVARYPLRTHVVTSSDDLVEVVRRYALPSLTTTDTLVISERIVAITQGRAFAIRDIVPSRWATFLVRFVTKSPYGIGLGSPWTMELAIREAGLPRMLLAAAIAALTKSFGIRGMFYRVIGKHINAIDGPCDYTIPIAFSPLPAGRGSERGRVERYAKLGPKDSDGVATRLAREIGVDVAIVDANDLGVNVLGASEGVDRTFVRATLKDNPLGQSDEQTPMAIVRLAVA